MAPPRARGFSVVEALAATTMLGVAGAMLAAGFGVIGAARARAGLRSGAAILAGERLSLLSRRPCEARDTSGEGRAGTAVSRWAAERTAGGWTFAETTIAPRAGPPLVVEGEVACRP